MGGLGGGGSGYASEVGSGAGVADTEGATDATTGVSMGLAEDNVAEGTSSMGDGLGDAQAERASKAQKARRRKGMGVGMLRN